MLIDSSRKCKWNCPEETNDIRWNMQEYRNTYVEIICLPNRILNMVALNLSSLFVSIFISEIWKKLNLL